MQITGCLRWIDSIMKEVKRVNLSEKEKKAINISLIILGIILSCVSFLCPIVALQGVILSLGISILTTVIVGFYEKFFNDSKSTVLEEKIQRIGLIDVDYNKIAQSQKEIYRNAKKIRMIFSAGMMTLRTYQQEIISLIVDNQCDIQIVLSSDEILENGTSMTPPGENTESLKLIRNIIKRVSELHGEGSIELRYSNIAPICSLEIKDVDFCIVTPYLYKQFSADNYHTTYRNTGKEADIYHKWEQHFTDIWDEAITKVSYNIEK